jgi:acetyl-CoA synthetase
VESALIEHPAVLECAITAVPDPDRGQIVKATVVLTKDYHPSDELVKELQDHVKQVTAPYKYPRIVEFVTELPKTISGKIRRVQIRNNDTDRI